MGLHHNFYFGRNEANIREWLEYFVSTMATTFEVVGNRVKEIYENSKDKIDVLLFFDSKIEQSQVHTEFAQFLIVV